ncbi:MAG TPA: type II CAAX endopeptidase family protein [Terriglobia bacterium]|nr:type II CAAX endopeptidase family protein [Terriglobia bacterium]
MPDSPGADQERPFKWERNDLIVFAVFFAGVVIFLPSVMLSILRMYQPQLSIENLSGVQQILMQAVMDFLLVGFIVFLVAGIHGQPLLRTLYFVPARLAVGRLVLGGVFLALTVVLMSSLFPPPSDSPLEKLLTTTPSVVVFVLFGIAFAPLLEEIVFRGFIFSALADLYGWKAALPITAILFAALHVSQLRGNWPAVAVILFVGYVLTVARQRSGSLVPSIIIHTAYNATIFLLAALSTVAGSGSAGSPAN